MAMRGNDLTVEQLNKLIQKLDEQIEGLQSLMDMEQQFTHAKHGNMRFSAVKNTLELERTGYRALLSRKTILGR